MVNRAIRMGVTLALVTGCMRPSDVDPMAPVKLPPPPCDDAAQREQVCRELRDARLLTDSGSVPLVLDECSPNSFGALVRWHGTNGVAFDYNGVVRFDWSEPRTRMTPVEVGWFQRQWSAGEAGADHVGRLLVPVGSACGGPNDQREWHELELPGPNESGCVSGPWLRGSQTRWCTQKLTAATELYAVYDFGWFRERQTWRVAVASTEVLISRGADRKRISDATSVARITSQLGALWNLEPWIDEQCRDGGETIVEALRANTWRTITRGCSDPGGVLSLLQELGPPAGTRTVPGLQH
jgi:hypothetical protein